MNGTLSPVLQLTFIGLEDRAITAQESGIAILNPRLRLFPTPNTSPVGAEKAAMSATTASASSSPSPRGGALAWLLGLWRALRPSTASAKGTTILDVAGAEDAISDVPRLQLMGSHHLRGFREFTAPRRMQLGAATPMRARAVGQRASLQRRRA